MKNNRSEPGLIYSVANRMFPIALHYQVFQSPCHKSISEKNVYHTSHQMHEMPCMGSNTYFPN